MKETKIYKICDVLFTTYILVYVIQKKKNFFSSKKKIKNKK